MLASRVGAIRAGYSCDIACSVELWHMPLTRAGAVAAPKASKLAALLGSSFCGNCVVGFTQEAIYPLHALSSLRLHALYRVIRGTELLAIDRSTDSFVAHSVPLASNGIEPAITRLEC